MKILVRLPNWLGDIVMSAAFLRGLSASYPGAAISVIIKTELQGLVPFLPGVGHSYHFSKKEFPGLGGAWRFGRGLRDEKFDLYIALPGSFSAALMGFATGARRRLGFRQEFRSIALTHSYDKPKGLHRVLEYVHLLDRFTGKKSAIIPELGRSNQERARRNVLINFNSEASSRRMPLAKARIVLRAIAEAFPAEELACIGAPKERAFINDVLNGVSTAKPVSNLAGNTTLEELITILACAKVLLTTDSGPAHLANGLGTPVIVLFGAGDEHQTAPFREEDRHILRAGRLSCEPCVKNTCPLYAQPECMNLLDEPTIIETLKLYLPDVKERGRQGV